MKITRYHKRLKYTYMKVAGGILVVAALFFPSYVKWEAPAENMFTVSLNGEEVGVVAEKETAEKLLQEARKELVSGRDGLVFMDVDMNLRGQAVLVGKIDDEDSVRSRMKQVLEHNIKETTHRSYAVKINNYMVNLGSREDVLSLLQQAVDKYDTEGRYQVNLTMPRAGNSTYLPHRSKTRRTKKRPAGIAAPYR